MKNKEKEKPLFNGCPEFFNEFSKRLVATEEGRCLAQRQRVRLLELENGQFRVDGLSSAASKWRLARAVDGLSYSAEDEAGISNALADAYSAQARVTLSVIAFEAFARIFSVKDWRNVQTLVFKEIENKLCEEVREFLEKDSILEKLKLGSRPKQAESLDNFVSGVDVELYPVCVAIRNAFAHGKIGSRPRLTDLAPKLQDFVLCGIENYCNEIGNQG